MPSSSTRFARPGAAQVRKISAERRRDRRGRPWPCPRPATACACGSRAAPRRAAAPRPSTRRARRARASRGPRGCRRRDCAGSTRQFAASAALPRSPTAAGLSRRVSQRARRTSPIAPARTSSVTRRERRRPEPVVHGAERPVLLRGERGQAAELLGREHQRLLAEHVERALERGASERRVRRRRRADVDEVELGSLRQELLGAVVPAGVRDGSRRGARGVPGARPRRPRSRRRSLAPARQVAADRDVADPDQRALQRHDADPVRTRGRPPRGRPDSGVRLSEGRRQSPAAYVSFHSRATAVSASSKSAVPRARSPRECSAADSAG